jgi:hypothetical protein
MSSLQENFQTVMLLRGSRRCALGSKQKRSPASLRHTKRERSRVLPPIRLSMPRLVELNYNALPIGTIFTRLSCSPIEWGWVAPADETRSRPTNDARERGCGEGPVDRLVSILPTSSRVRSGGMVERYGPHHISLMNLPLTDEEAAVLTRELTDITWNDRFPLSPRIRTLSAILGKLKPATARPAASPEPRVYAPPTKGRWRRRGRGQ